MYFEHKMHNPRYLYECISYVYRDWSTYCVFRFLHKYRQHDVTIHSVYRPGRQATYYTSVAGFIRLLVYANIIVVPISADEIILQRDIMLHRHPRRCWNCGILTRDELFLKKWRGLVQATARSCVYTYMGTFGARNSLSPY